MVKWGLYRAIFRYTGFSAMLTTVQAIALYGVLFGAYVIFVGNPTHVPRSIAVLQPLLFLLLVGGNRAFIRALFAYGESHGTRQQGRLLIYGAGDTGIQTAAAIASARQFTLIGFIDNDPRKIGRSINGLEIWSERNLAQIVQDSAVTDILLAIPSMERSERNAIIQSLRDLAVHVRSVPNMAALTSGMAVVQQFQELDVEDLLGRDPVAPVPALIERNIRQQVVLVTGAGGSIGSELCRQIVQQAPLCLLLLENSEFALYQIDQELRALAATQPQPPTIVALLGDVRDLHRMRQIVRTWQPATIYHAAAYKHVPMVERNPAQGISNNVFGTLTVARTALEAGVPHCILISTDKAVRPTNIMGASKRLAELCLQALASYQPNQQQPNCSQPDFALLDANASQMPPTQAAPATTPPAQTAAQQPRTCFSMVRFGNVLGSSGSVVPLFRQQIAHGGPITLTHAEVTRYFMTIPEAAQLVLQAGAMAQGGDVFVLDMGEPVKISELARQMVMLSGFTVRDATHPHGDIALHITGLRPGEKLYEELLIGDNPQPTEHPRIMRAQEASIAWEQLQSHLVQLQAMMQDNNMQGITSLLQQLVSGFRPGPVVDNVALEQSQHSSAPQANSL
ncbi:MAG: polysaccharide biosynthesis protein [Brachymonas sp.]|nr:polysaccharide biosynthesis protein [Brachymonas sp.]MBP7744436.1 polysaccharide biosynthesis protein [Brachymonas sp.]